MSIINIDLNQEKIHIEKFNSTNDKMKKTFTNTMSNCKNDITALNIFYFDELEEYAKQVSDENDKYYIGTKYYTDALNDLKQTITYKIKQEPSFKVPTGISGERDSITDGKGSMGYQSGLGEYTDDSNDITDALKVQDHTSGLNEYEDDESSISSASKAKDYVAGLGGLPSYPDEEKLEEAGNAGLEMPTMPKYDDVTYDDSLLSAAALQMPNFSDLFVNKDSDDKITSTFTPFGSSYGAINDPSLDGKMEEKDNNSPSLSDYSEQGLDIENVEFSQAGNGELGVINEDDSSINNALGVDETEGLLKDVKKSGLSGGTIAGTLLSALLTGALGFSSLYFDKVKNGENGEFNLDALSQGPTIVKDAENNQEMLVGQNITTTYKDPQFQLAEYSQNYISDLVRNTEIPQTDYDLIVQKFANEFGTLSQKELEFGMSGMPYAFENFTSEDNSILFQELASLIDKYGGVEGFLEHFDEIQNYLKKVGECYDILNGIINLPIEEQINALRGLLDEDNPNIGGIVISKEARDFIVAYLENFTGLSFEELLSGEHNEELKHALLSLLQVLKIIKAMGSLSFEEFEMFLYDLLNGRFPDLCGITTVNVAVLKHYLNEKAEDINITYDEIVSNYEFKDELKQLLMDFSASKVDLGKLANLSDLFDVVEKIIKKEEESLVVKLSPNTINIIRKLTEMYAKYCKKDIKLIMYSIGFKEYLSSLINSIYKYTMFVGMLSNMHDDTLQLRIYETFMGYWLGLLGFTVNEIGNLKKKIEKAKDKYNIELSLIVNDISNKEALKSIIEDDDIYFRLLLIFDELNDEKLQIIVGNLLKSWENEHLYDLKNLIIYANRKKLSSIIDYCKGKIDYDSDEIKINSLEEMIKKLYSLDDLQLYKELENIYYRKSSLIDKDENGMLLIYLIIITLYALSVLYTMTVSDILKDDDKKKNAYEMIKNTPYYINYINPRNKLFDVNVISDFMVNLLNGSYINLIGEANLEI